MLDATAVLYLKKAFCSYVTLTGTGIKTGSPALAQLFFQEMQSHLYWNTALTHKKAAVFSEAFVSTLLETHFISKRLMKARTEAG